MLAGIVVFIIVFLYLQLWIYRAQRNDHWIANALRGGKRKNRPSKR